MEITKYKNIYNIKKHRLCGYDYSQNGVYFITICTKFREKYFGEIINHKMILNEIGLIAERELINTQKFRKNIAIDCYVIMPNHVHVLIQINKFENTPVEPCESVEPCRGMALQTPITQNFNKFSRPIHNSIGTIINHYKSSIKRYANKNNIEFEWQARYYDKIIRTEKELANVKTYIINNPINWQKDKNYI